MNKVSAEGNPGRDKFPPVRYTRLTPVRDKTSPVRGEHRYSFFKEGFLNPDFSEIPPRNPSPPCDTAQRRTKAQPPSPRFRPPAPPPPTPEHRRTARSRPSLAPPLCIADAPWPSPNSPEKSPPQNPLKIPLFLAIYTQSEMGLFNKKRKVEATTPPEPKDKVVLNKAFKSDFSRHLARKHTPCRW